MEVKKISRTILNIQKNLSLKLHVKLVSVDENGQTRLFHNEYEYEGSNYIKIDNMPFMTLDMREKDIEWDKSHSIMITPMNIVHVVKGMERLLEAIYGDDVFAVDRNDKIVIYKDMVEKHTEKIFNLGMNQRLVLKPAIILDHNDTEMEGVLLYINKPENVVELSIDAFESLLYNLQKIDLFTYSQLLINYYVSQKNIDSRREPVERYKYTPPKREVFTTQESSSKIQGNIKRNIDVFDGLGKN